MPRSYRSPQSGDDLGSQKPDQGRFGWKAVVRMRSVERQRRADSGRSATIGEFVGFGPQSCRSSSASRWLIVTRSGPRSELEVGLVRASLLVHGSRRGLETTQQAVDVPGTPTGPGSRSPRSRDRRTEPRTALPWRRVIRTPAICRARAAGRSSPHSAGVGRQPIRMIGLNGSRPSRQMRGWSI